MSLEKLYNYVRGVMQRNEVCINEYDKEKILELLPLSKDLRSALSGGQSRAIRNVLKNMDRWPIQAQGLELQIISMRLAKMIEFEEPPICDKCGESAQEITAIAVGKDLYSCCSTCTEEICKFITE